MEESIHLERMKLINLYPHQKEALDITRGLHHVAYYYDCGLGKTYIGSEKCDELLKEGCNKVLCVCQKSKVDDWVNHFRDNYNYKTFDLTEDRKLIGDFIREEEKSIGVINYDLLIRRPELKYLSLFILLLDESALIQNNKTSRCKYVMDMRPRAVVLLSGTPGKYEKLWSQCRLLNWNIYKKDFDRMYMNYNLMDFHTGRLVKVLDKTNPYKNIDNLKENMRRHGAVFKKTEEVLDLPEQNFIDIKVKRTKEYEKFLKDKIITIDDTELVGDHAFKKYLFKRRLCSSYNKEKLTAIKDLLDSTDDRLIIFYNWNDELKVLKDICKDRPLSIINGAIKDLSNFETHDNSITLVQYQAGSMGLNLQKANKIIYFSPTDKSDLYQQSIKRIHRIGATKPCFYYRLITEKSIEGKIYESLAKQEDYTNYLFEED